MLIHKRYTSILLILWFTTSAFSQYYESGQDPAFLKWKQIHTEHFRLIFPESFIQEGLRLANMLEYAYTLVPNTLNHSPRKIPVIVHNYSARSNGFVAWAPKRMELYPIPAADSWPQDELEQLVLHELRHVVQLDKLNNGFSKGLSIVFGEQLVGALSAMLPMWFLEGDAVLSETTLSKSGRGRLPSFEMELRALSVEQDSVYKYDKTVFGSYKDNIPSYYNSGYQVVSFTQAKYGTKLWQDALNKTGRQPYTLNPVSLSLKRNTGFTKKKLFETSLKELHDLWTIQDNKISTTAFSTITYKPHKNYTSYRFPQYISDSTLIAEKSGIDQLHRIVIVNKNGHEEAIHTPGFYSPVRFSYSSNSLVWAENYSDPRWENRSYSIIKKLDLLNGKESTLGKKTRYFSPVLSGDGLKTACIEAGLANKMSLVILDTEKGGKLDTYSIPGNNSLHMPEWTDDGKLIVLLVNEKGKSIMELNPESGKWTELLAPSFYDIQKIIAWKEYIIYHSTYSGIDNIYALNRLTGEKFQVTSSRFGARYPCLSPAKTKLAYSDYSSSGFNLVEIELDPGSWKPLDRVEDQSLKTYKTLQEQQTGSFDITETPDSAYIIRPYRKAGNLFSFHSWMPFYFDYDNFSLEEVSVTAGATILSQNRLSTAVSSLAYSYKDGEHFFISRFTYKGWYPVIDIDYKYGGKPIIRKPSPVSEPMEYSFQSVFNTNIYIPLHLTRNKFIRGLYPSINIQYNNSYIYNEAEEYYEIGELLTGARLYFYNYQKLSLRDIKPRLGIVSDLYFRTAPFNKETFGNSGSALLGVYLPGIARHHSIYLQAGTEKQKTSKYLYYNRLSFPRGYQSRVSEKLKVLKLDYYFPLFYPEINIASIIYIPRFYANAFYDRALGEGNYNLNGGYVEEEQLFSSLGTKIFMDFFFLRIPFPFNIGLRYSYMPELQEQAFKISFGVDFNGFQINR